MGGKNESREFNIKRGQLGDLMKVLLGKLGLRNEFQLIALGISAMREAIGEGNTLGGQPQG